MADTLSPAVETRAPLPSLERRKEYCCKLSRVITRYADDEETAELTRTLEQFMRAVLAHRDCPGLNAAAYDAYARTLLK